MSNGGDMSYLLACQASDVFKAVAPVAGCMMAWILTACMPADPIPVFKIHGTADDITYWAGDINNNQGWGPYYDVLTTFNFWVQLNNCTESIVDTLPNTNTSDGSYVVAHKHWNDNNNQVWLYEVVNGGHDWPGEWGNMDINASEEIWNFFTLVVEDSSNIHIENEGQHPTAFALLQNYPNPFNPVTTIRYDLPQESHVHLVIYDILGREVKTIVNSKEQAGYRSVRWDGLNSYGQEVSAGMYFYRLETSDFSKVQKMVLLK
jgi:polyhydroxybutyrate depolymerase